MSRLIILAGVLSVSVMPGIAGDIVEIRLHGRYFAEPATVQVTVAVEPDQANRVLRVEADGERFFRASEVNLSGDADKRLHTLEFKNLPAGAYQLRAEVMSNHSVRGKAVQELVVAGTGGF